MLKKKKRMPGGQTGDSVNRKSTGRYRAVVLLSSVLAVLALSAGLFCLQAKADTGGGNTETVVIRTTSETEFAMESSDLAKASRGLTLQSKGKVQPYSSGRLIVSVRNGKTIDFSKYNATKVVESTFGVSLVQFSSASEAKKAAKKIAALSDVAYVEPDDCTVNIGDVEVSDISMDGSQTEEIEIPSSQEETSGAVNVGNLNTADGAYGSGADLAYDNSVQTSSVSASASTMSWGASYIQADKYAAYVKANTTRAIKVAVVDSGVSSHTKLKGRILPGKDFVDNDSNPADKNGHGTHVAGVIVDCTPGINVKILPVRVMNASGEGNPSVVGNGIRYAVNSGAKVINLSLGAYTHYSYIEQCITYAYNKGVTVVVAAGNECDNTAYVCPAHMSTPIVVGAIDSKGQRAFFSNYGTSLDITAPGVEIRSCWLNGGYATMSGTSMAAPHISAAAAMYRIMNPSYKASKTEYAVRCYAKDLGSKGTDKYYGRGVPRMAGAIAPSNVSMSRKTASVEVKKTLTLTAAVSPAYAGMNKLTWSSSDNTVATVSGGRVYAEGIGTATITAKTVNGKTTSCKVTVTSPSTDPIRVGTLKKSVTSSSFSGEVTTASRAPITEYSDSSVTVTDQITEAPAPSSDVSSGKTVTTEKTASAKAQEVKIYIYPSEKTGNTPVQDGSIVEGSRLALEAEIVPSDSDYSALQWKSSDPGTASVDEEGIVTAVSAGEAKITAVLPATDGSSAGAQATYTVKVVKPSVLTRNASYNAGDEEEIRIETVLRLPASLSDDSGDDADRINPAADYVLAILNKEGEDCTLLGAVNLGGDDDGTVHIHYSGSGDRRTDVTEIKGTSAGEDAPYQILSDQACGKQASESGILYLRTSDADGCKANLSLGADIAALRAAAPAGEARTEKLSNCLLAVYTDAAFEEREEAVESGDEEKIRELDEKALCTCRFSLSYDIPELPVQEEEEAGQTADSGTGNSTQSGNGSESAGADDNSDKSDSSRKDTDSDEGNDADADTDGKDGGANENSGSGSGGETEEEQEGAAEVSDRSHSAQSPEEDDSAQAEENDEEDDADEAEDTADNLPADDTDEPESVTSDDGGKEDDQAASAQEASENEADGDSAQDSSPAAEADTSSDTVSDTAAGAAASEEPAQADG